MRERAGADVREAISAAYRLKPTSPGSHTLPTGACRVGPLARFRTPRGSSPPRTPQKPWLPKLRLDNYWHDHRPAAMGSANPLAHPAADKLLQFMGVGGAVAQGLL